MFSHWQRIAIVCAQICGHRSISQWIAHAFERRRFWSGILHDISVCFHCKLKSLELLPATCCDMRLCQSGNVRMPDLVKRGQSQLQSRNSSWQTSERFPWNILCFTQHCCSIFSGPMSWVQTQTHPQRVIVWVPSTSQSPQISCEAGSLAIQDYSFNDWLNTFK